MVRLRNLFVALAVLAILIAGTLVTPSDAQGNLYRTRNLNLGFQVETLMIAPAASVVAVLSARSSRMAPPSTSLATTMCWDVPMGPSLVRIFHSRV